DEAGEAVLSVPMPDNLTTWKIKVWAMGHGTVVGEGEAEIITRKDLLVRLQAPRFFVEKDEVTLSAIVHHVLDGEREVEVSLELEGEGLEALDDDLLRTVAIKSGEDRRIDWRVKAVGEGEAIVRMKAASGDERDGMEMNYPVRVHGALRTESWSGVLPDGEEASELSLVVPAERRPEQSRLEIRYSPSIAMAMVDALPWLTTWPHKNSESVLNRFVPALVTRTLLEEMDIDLAGLQEKVTNLNPREIGDDVERAAQWRKRKANPIFDPTRFDRLVNQGLAELNRLQNDDGGWGWTPGSSSDAHMTAWVVRGLLAAKASGLAVVNDTLDEGIEWLKQHQAEEVRLLGNADGDRTPGKRAADNLDALIFCVLVDGGVVDQRMLAWLYRDRLGLAKTSQALFGLACDRLDQDRERDMIVRNLSQFLVRDPENQTARLDLKNRTYWWRWYGNEIETQAMFLKLLVRTHPRSEIARGLVKYLLNNRKHATAWHSTRDTALCLEALADYIRATGEDRPDMTVEIRIDGKERKRIRITPENLFTYDNRIVLEGPALTTGEHQVEFRRQGKGPLYYNAVFTSFSLEDDIRKAGLDIKVTRTWYRLEPLKREVASTGTRGQVVEQRTEAWRRVPLKNQDDVRSGDQVEVELLIESRNDYEYLVFEDPKPAGFEPVEIRSGTGGNSLGAYMELRDEKVTFQVRRLSTGRHSLTYRLRAETPGRFSALPTQAFGMYAPELRANSDSLKIRVSDP
ncbi:MAG: alpha-2-macroglobulin family protein, partial [Verrucomicrobiota bacterium]